MFDSYKRMGRASMSRLCADAFSRPLSLATFTRIAYAASGTMRSSETRRRAGSSRSSARSKLSLLMPGLDFVDEQPWIDHPRRAARQARLARSRLSSLRTLGASQPWAADRGARRRYGAAHLWESLAGDCPNARTTALNNRCAIYYPQLPALFLPGKET